MEHLLIVCGILAGVIMLAILLRKTVEVVFAIEGTFGVTMLLAAVFLFTVCVGAGGVGYHLQSGNMITAQGADFIQAISSYSLFGSVAYVVAVDGG